MPKSELHKKVWAIITADKVLHMNLTYNKASRKVNHLVKKSLVNASVVAIVSNEAAKRMKENEII